MASGLKTGGRTKGTPNKVTKALREMILSALDEAGGTEYFVRQADENPSAFLRLIGRMLPTTLTGDPEQPVAIAPITTPEREEQARRIIAEAFHKPAPAPV
jgi:hypothetical protein